MYAYSRNASFVNNCTTPIKMICGRLMSTCAQEEYLKSIIKNIGSINGTTKLPNSQESEEMYTAPGHQNELREPKPSHIVQSRISPRNHHSDKIKNVVPIKDCIKVKNKTNSVPSNVPLQKSSVESRSHLIQTLTTGETGLQKLNTSRLTSIVPVKSILNPSDPIMCSISSLRQWFKALDLNALEPLPQPAANLAAYLPNSYTLTQLTKLGVNLSKIETLPGVANMLVKMDFKTEIEPFLWMFSDFGFEPSQMARILTVFPKVLKLQLDEVRSRLAYFLNHGFSSVEVVSVIHKQPLILQETSIQVDQRLGQIQTLFEFEGQDIRNVVIAQPKIVIHPLGKIKDIYVILTKAMGFSITTCQNLIRSYPKLLRSERDRISTNFVIMHSRLNLSPELIQLWPEALVVSPHLLTERTSLLVSRKLFQPDPKKPLYTPLGIIVSLNDEEFCRHYGRISEEEYDKFLRTL